MLSDLTVLRMDERKLDAARAQRAAAKSAISASVVAAHDPDAAHSGSVVTRANATVLSLRLEIVAHQSYPAQAQWAQVVEARSEQNAPALPDSQPSAANSYEAPLTRRAIAAYGAQREFQPPAVRGDERAVTPRVSLRA